MEIVVRLRHDDEGAVQMRVFDPHEVPEKQNLVRTWRPRGKVNPLVSARMLIDRMKERVAHVHPGATVRVEEG